MSIESRLAIARSAVELLHGRLPSQLHMSYAPYGPEKAHAELTDIANHPDATEVQKAEIPALLAELRRKYPQWFNNGD